LAAAWRRPSLPAAPAPGPG